MELKDLNLTDDEIRATCIGYCIVGTSLWDLLDANIDDETCRNTVDLMLDGIDGDKVRQYVETYRKIGQWLKDHRDDCIVELERIEVAQID